MEIKLYKGGYCLANRKHVFKGTSSKMIRFYTSWTHIQHPELGNILFDTGYSTRFFSSTSAWPDRIYRHTTRVFATAEESCAVQLKVSGIDPDSIEHIVISHFHADHIGGLKDFPSAKFWCHKDALAFVNSRTRLNGVFSGVLKALLPADISQRSFHPEQILEKGKLNVFDSWKWSDGISFVKLPGHFKGQLGLYLEGTNLGDVFLVADAGWTDDTIYRKQYPSRITSLIVDNYKELKLTMDQLHDFHNKHQNVKIITTHSCDNEYYK